MEDLNSLKTSGNLFLKSQKNCDWRFIWANRMNGDDFLAFSKNKRIIFIFFYILLENQRKKIHWFLKKYFLTIFFKYSFSTFKVFITKDKTYLWHPLIISAPFEHLLLDSEEKKNHNHFFKKNAFSQLTVISLYNNPDRENIFNKINCEWVSELLLIIFFL